MNAIGTATDQKPTGKDGSHRVGCRTAMWKKMVVLKHLKFVILSWDLLPILCFVVAWTVHKT